MSDVYSITSGTGSLSEITRSSAGGGISGYVAAPIYQTSFIPGLGARTRRAVADVFFNADPNTGQYPAVMAQGSASVSWISAGGTSLATPQWAGIIAVANAQRVLAAKGLLGQVHSMLYGQIATAASKLTQLVGASASAPVVTSSGIAGTVSVPLTFTVSVAASNPVTCSLSSQPSGLTVDSTGAVSWAAPVADTYAVTITAKDSKTGLSGSRLYTITVRKPVAGDYAVTLSAKDSVTGLSGSGVFNVSISSAGRQIVA